MWSVMLGPTNQDIPDGLWDEYRDRNLIFVWDVYCKSYGTDRMTAYSVHLRRLDATGKLQSIPLGHTIKSTTLGESWNAFGSAGWPAVEGFASRRYAIQYMLQAGGFQKRH